jgi:hypothetical protein
MGLSLADFRAQRFGTNSGSKIDRNWDAAGAGDQISNDAAGDDTHGSRLIRQYAGKGITGTTAGLAYNLGIGHAQILATGLHNANPDGTGPQDYDFKNTANFDDTVHNFTKFAHHTLLRNDPRTNAA